MSEHNGHSSRFRLAGDVYAGPAARLVLPDGTPIQPSNAPPPNPLLTLRDAAIAMLTHLHRFGQPAGMLGLDAPTATALLRLLGVAHCALPLLARVRAGEWRGPELPPVLAAMAEELQNHGIMEGPGMEQAQGMAGEFWAAVSAAFEDPDATKA